MLVDKQGVRVYPPYIDRGIRHPDNIEQLWSAKQLEAIGLRKQVETPTVEQVKATSLVERHKFFLQLKVDGKLTKGQTLAMLKGGVLPPFITTSINRLIGEDAQLAAEALLSAGSYIGITDPIAIEIGKSANWDASELQAFFNRASER